VDDDGSLYDARFVNVTGDTMTGTLVINRQDNASQLQLKGPATGANDLNIGRNDTTDGAVTPRIQLFTGNGVPSALIRASVANAGLSMNSVLDFYSRTANGLRHIDANLANRVTDLIRGSTRQYSTQALMQADAVNCLTGTLAVTVDTTPYMVWVRSATGWLCIYQDSGWVNAVAHANFTQTVTVQTRRTNDTVHVRGGGTAAVLLGTSQPCFYAVADHRPEVDAWLTLSFPWTHTVANLQSPVTWVGDFSIGAADGQGRFRGIGPFPPAAAGVNFRGTWPVATKTLAPT
jgi:hypothetical protein